MSRLKRRLMIILFAVGVMSLAASANAACVPGAPQLIIYHAGSLSAAFAAAPQLFTQQTGVCVTDVAAGSVDAARRITTGQEPCDIFASADFEIIDLMLKPAGFADYDILFGQGGMVLAYTTSSKNAATITSPGGVFNPPASVPAVADDWYMQLMQPVGCDRRFSPLSRSERLPRRPDLSAGRSAIPVAQSLRPVAGTLLSYQGYRRAGKDL